MIHKKINILIFYLLLSLFLIVVLSFNVTAVEDQRPSLFDNISKFFNLIFQGEKRVINNVPLPEEEIKQVRLIDLERLELLIGSSDCLKQLPKSSAIKLKIFNEEGNKSEFFISNGLKIDLYSRQKTDLKVGLSLKDILSLEKSIYVDGELRSLINSEDLEFEYNIFRALKYRKVLSCIKNSEIVIEELEKKIELEETQEDKIPIIETEKNVTLPDAEPTKVTIFNKEELEPKKLKYLFDDFENNVPYIIISDNPDDYNNLRAIKLLSNWNYAINNVNYNSIGDEGDVSSQNIIFISYECDNEISMLEIKESECKNKLDNKKGTINFYNEDSRNILFIIGYDGQDLVDSTSILSSYWLYEFNNSENIMTDDDMYKIVNIPVRLNEIANEVKSIQSRVLDYDSQLQSQRQFRPTEYILAYISGDKFREIFDRDNEYDTSKYNAGELIRKGDVVAKKRTSIRLKINNLKSLISGILNVKIDKNVLNLETLEEHEMKLESIQNDFEILEKDYNEFTDLANEIIPAYISLSGRNIVYIR